MGLLANLQKDVKQIKTKLSLENNTVELKDAEIYVPDYPLDGLQANIVENRCFFEQDILNDLDKYIDNESVILDIGANIGNHTVYWAKKPNVHQIYSFEPVKRTYRKLLKNIEINNLEDKVKPFNIGLSDQTTNASIDRLYTFSTGATVLKKDDNGSFILKKLDDLVKECKIHRIDFIKIDTEGFEKSVLLGASDVLSTFSPIVFIEVEKENIDWVKKFFINNNYILEKEYPS